MEKKDRAHLNKSFISLKNIETRRWGSWARSVDGGIRQIVSEHTWVT